ERRSRRRSVHFGVPRIQVAPRAKREGLAERPCERDRGSRDVRRQTQSPVHPAALDAYRCPYSGEALTLKQAPGRGSEHARHLLVSPSGLEYEVLDGMPHLLKSELESFSPTEEREKQYYEETARDYDAVIEWLFRSFGENEDDVRRRMVDLRRTSSSFSPKLRKSHSITAS